MEALSLSVSVIMVVVAAVVDSRVVVHGRKFSFLFLPFPSFLHRNPKLTIFFWNESLFWKARLSFFFLPCVWMMDVWMDDEADGMGLEECGLS